MNKLEITIVGTKEQVKNALDELMESTFVLNRGRITIILTDKPLTPEDVTTIRERGVRPFPRSHSRSSGSDD